MNSYLTHEESFVTSHTDRPHWYKLFRGGGTRDYIPKSVYDKWVEQGLTQFTDHYKPYDLTCPSCQSPVDPIYMEDFLNVTYSPLILKGIAKDLSNIIFVWNTELAPPHEAGYYPKVGNDTISYSTKDYEFKPVKLVDVPLFEEYLKQKEEINTTFLDEDGLKLCSHCDHSGKAVGRDRGRLWLS